MTEIQTPGSRNQRPLSVVLGLTSLYLVAEVVGGLWTGSLALLADAGHMLTDVAGLGLALFAIRFAARPATPERTYGYYRVEILAALANAVALILISLYILFEAYQRFRSPPPVASGVMLAVAAVGLCVNIASVLILRRTSTESLNMKAAYFEVLSDMLTSIGVIVAGLIMLTTGWYYADPLVSAGIGLFILPRTWILLTEAVGVLLEGAPADINLATLRQAIGDIPGVASLHDVHVWTLTSGVHAMSAHVVLADGSTHDEVLSRVHERITSGFNISHLTVQVESRSYAVHNTHL